MRKHYIIVAENQETSRYIMYRGMDHTPREAYLHFLMAPLPGNQNINDYTIVTFTQEDLWSYLVACLTRHPLLSTSINPNTDL